MVKNTIYRITVLNWSKYNSKSKKHFKSTLISNNFTSDAKLLTLPIYARWLFLDVVLTCGDHSVDTVEYTSSQLRIVLMNKVCIDDVLNSLKQIQVLTYTKNASLRIEENRIEENSTDLKKQPSTQLAKAQLRGCHNSFIFDPVLEKLLAKESIELQSSWIATYPSVNFIVSEIHKADVWINANPRKAPKKFGRFMSSWLNRAFETYRKTIPTNTEKKRRFPSDPRPGDPGYEDWLRL